MPEAQSGEVGCGGFLERRISPWATASISTLGGGGQPGSLSIEQFQGKVPKQSRDHLACSQERILCWGGGGPCPRPQMQVFLV